MWRDLKVLLIKLYVIVWQVLRVCSGLILFSCAAVGGGACHPTLVRMEAHKVPAPAVGHDVSNEMELQDKGWFEADDFTANRDAGSKIVFCRLLNSWVVDEVKMNRAVGTLCLLIVWNLLRVIVLCLLLVSPIGLGGLAILSEFYTGITSWGVEGQSSKTCEESSNLKFDGWD